MIYRSYQSCRSNNLDLTSYVGQVIDLTTYAGKIIDLTSYVCQIMDLTSYVGQIIDLTSYVGQITDLTSYVGQIIDPTSYVGQIIDLSLCWLGNFLIGQHSMYGVLRKHLPSGLPCLFCENACYRKFTKTPAVESRS